MQIYLDFLPLTALHKWFLVSTTDSKWTVEQLKPGIKRFEVLRSECDSD